MGGGGGGGGNHQPFPLKIWHPIPTAILNNGLFDVSGKAIYWAEFFEVWLVLILD